MYTELGKDERFSKAYSTWIIAYCLDTNSFFVTNQRHFYWEHNKEFQTENDAVNYFKAHLDDFLNIRNEILIKTGGWNINSDLYLENTRESFKCIPPVFKIEDFEQKINELKTIKVDIGFGTIVETVRKDVLMDMISEAKKGLNRSVTIQETRPSIMKHDDQSVIRDFVTWLCNRYEIHESEEDGYTLCGDLKEYGPNEIFQEYFDKFKAIDKDNSDKNDDYDR